MIAKLTKAKKGKTTAWAHAKKMLNYIKDFGNAEAKSRANVYEEKCELITPLTDEELLALLLNAEKS